MIICKKCGYHGDYKSSKCPECGSLFSLSADELNIKERELAEARVAKNHRLAAECLHILADAGITEYECEYASHLERGSGSDTRGLDEAMIYFSRAAMKNHAYAAFRYSRLAERTSSRAGDFWLAFSAVLGCSDAFPVMAERLSRTGKEREAHYYYAMSCAEDKSDAIVTMAKRYYEGVGIEKNDEYAKWYIDRLFLPPFHAVKMAYRLRSVKPKDPGEPKHPDLDRHLRALAIDARELGFDNAYYRLTEMLSERGDLKARCTLGMLTLEGVGCKQDISAGFSILTDAATCKYADAYVRLGEQYLLGKHLPKDAERALDCFKSAAELGMPNAYESIGDIYRDGEMLNKDIPTAINYYDLAAKEGVLTAKTKAERLRAHREDLYVRARTLEQTEPKEAFKYYAISTGMGYLPAYTELARCYILGIGTDIDRPEGFSWYKRAADLGYTDAYTPLGLCYSKGVGTAFNYKESLRILSRAMRAGSHTAAKEVERLLGNKKRAVLAKIYSKGMRLIHMKKFTEAERILRTCLREGHGKGVYTLGCMHEFGLGIATNRELATRLYEQAFDLKFRDPRAVYKLQILRMARTYKTSWER